MLQEVVVSSKPLQWCQEIKFGGGWFPAACSAFYLRGSRRGRRTRPLQPRRLRILLHLLRKQNSRARTRAPNRRHRTRLLNPRLTRLLTTRLLAPQLSALHLRLTHRHRRKAKRRVQIPARRAQIPAQQRVRSRLPKRADSRPSTPIERAKFRLR